MAYKLISDEEKAKTKDSLKELKKEWNGLLGDLGISKKTSTNNKNKNDNEIIKEQVREIKKNNKEKCAFVILFALILCVICMCFSIASFISKNILIGGLLLFLLFVIISLTIFICLKITKAKISDELILLMFGIVFFGLFITMAISGAIYSH